MPHKEYQYLVKFDIFGKICKFCLNNDLTIGYCAVGAQ